MPREDPANPAKTLGLPHATSFPARVFDIRIAMPRLSSLSPVIRPGKPGLILFPLLAALFAATACAGKIYVVTSLSLPQAIAVDGDAEEWSGALSYVAQAGLFVGFVNDRDNLYICLNKEEEEEAGPARAGGWTVWFDPAGGTQKAFGLRIGPAEGPFERNPGDRRTEPGRDVAPENGRAGEPPGQAPQGEQAPPTERSIEVQWIGASGDVLRRFSPEAAAELGLEVAEGRAGGAFVLELKIPLRESEGHPFAIGAGPDGLVGVGLFSYKPERRGERGGRGGGMGGGRGGLPGGMPGGGMSGGLEGGRGGWRGAMRPNMNPDIAKTVKVWTRVRLLRSDAPGRSKVLDVTFE
jgi:hypothetical protein